MRNMTMQSLKSSFLFRISCPKTWSPTVSLQGICFCTKEKKRRLEEQLEKMIKTSIMMMIKSPTVITKTRDFVHHEQSWLSSSKMVCVFSLWWLSSWNDPHIRFHGRSNLDNEDMSQGILTKSQDIVKKKLMTDDLSQWCLLVIVVYHCSQPLLLCCHVCLFLKRCLQDLTSSHTDVEVRVFLLSAWDSEWLHNLFGMTNEWCKEFQRHSNVMINSRRYLLDEAKCQ